MCPMLGGWASILIQKRSLCLILSTFVWLLYRQRRLDSDTASTTTTSQRSPTSVACSRGPATLCATACSTLQGMRLPWLFWGRVRLHSGLPYLRQATDGLSVWLGLRCLCWAFMFWEPSFVPQPTLTNQRLVSLCW